MYSALDRAAFRITRLLRSTAVRGAKPTRLLGEERISSAKLPVQDQGLGSERSQILRRAWRRAAIGRDVPANPNNATP